MTTVFTVIIEAHGMTVSEGLTQTRAKLHFEGGGIKVYTKGAVGRRRDTLNYVAMQIFKSCNVPLLQMRDVTVKKS